MIQWGVLGTSEISWKMAEAIQKNKDSTLHAVSGRNPENLAKIKQAFDFKKIYTSTEKLLADPKVDVVYIGLPTHCHARAIMQAARENKAILCEKSLTLDTRTANAALDIVNQEKVFFMEALMYRCHPFFEKIVQTISDNKIGQVEHIEAFYHADIHEVANPLGGGTIFNLGCYPLSTVLQFCKSDIILTPEKYTAKRAATQMTAVGLQNQKITAKISTADDLPFAWKLVIRGSEGILESISNPWFPDATRNQFKCHFKNKTEEIIEVHSEGNAYDYQIARVVEGLQNKQSEATGLAPNKAFSLKLMRALDDWNIRSLADTPIPACAL